MYCSFVSGHNTESVSSKTFNTFGVGASQVDSVGVLPLITFRLLLQKKTPYYSKVSSSKNKELVGKTFRC